MAETLRRVVWEDPEKLKKIGTETSAIGFFVRVLPNGYYQIVNDNPNDLGAWNPKIYGTKLCPGLIGCIGDPCMFCGFENKENHHG